MEPTLQLESFATPLHGTKILYFLSSSSSASVPAHPPWSEWIQKLREPFRKKMRVAPSLLPFRTRTVSTSYDTTFHIKDGQDWTLALTYMTYAPKPLLVVIEDTSIPDGLWSKLPPSTTLLHLMSQPVLRLSPYDAIFFTPMEEVSSSYMDDVHRILQAIYRSTYSTKEHKEVIQELRVAGAGLAWTRVGESTPQGSLYWYDPVSSPPHESMAPSQLTELFSWLAEQFRRENS